MQMSSLSIRDAVGTASHMLKFRLTWDRRKDDYQFELASNPKFMSARAAMRMIPDKSVVSVSGLGGNQRISYLSWALRALYQQTGQPKHLTLISAAGHGGRGKAPGTLEEWALPGLVDRFVCAHFETYKAQLALADQGKLRLDCVPLGMMALLVKAQAEGINQLVSSIGKGTFLDPETGTGSDILNGGPGLIQSQGDQLVYQLPLIDVAIFNAPAADTEGNIYIDGCSTICDAKEAAALIRETLPKGVYINIGTGLPEQVCRLLHDQGALSDYTLFTEAGVIGGMPAPGIFFGAGIAPQKIISSPEIFEIVENQLEATVLGFLQVDSQGNVNASKRGEGASQFVGPGGFIDLSCCAKHIFFVGSWMQGGEVRLTNGKTRIGKGGMFASKIKPKFVERVDQVTFNGQRALALGKQVFYITDVGTFQLTEQGMKLIVRRDGVSDEDIKRTSSLQWVY